MSDLPEGLDNNPVQLVRDCPIVIRDAEGRPLADAVLKAGTLVWLQRWTPDQIEAARRDGEELHRRLQRV